jgi:hypothetical protein
MPRCTLEEITSLQNIINKNTLAGDNIILWSLTGPLKVVRVSYLLRNITGILIKKNKNRVHSKAKYRILPYIRRMMKKTSTDYSDLLEVLEEDLLNIPLYINDSSVIKRSVAEWRLQIRR